MYFFFLLMFMLVGAIPLESASSEERPNVYNATSENLVVCSTWKVWQGHFNVMDYKVLPPGWSLYAARYLTLSIAKGDEKEQVMSGTRYDFTGSGWLSNKDKILIIENDPSNSRRLKATIILRNAFERYMSFDTEAKPARAGADAIERKSEERKIAASAGAGAGIGAGINVSERKSEQITIYNTARNRTLIFTVDEKEIIVKYGETYELNKELFKDLSTDLEIEFKVGNSAYPKLKVAAKKTLKELLSKKIITLTLEEEKDGSILDFF